MHVLQDTNTKEQRFGGEYERTGGEDAHTFVDDAKQKIDVSAQRAGLVFMFTNASHVLGLLKNQVCMSACDACFHVRSCKPICTTARRT
jgi:hypothetical protein